MFKRNTGRLIKLKLEKKLIDKRMLEPEESSYSEIEE
jgi:hypothetical protein